MSDCLWDFYSLERCFPSVSRHLTIFYLPCSPLLFVCYFIFSSSTLSSFLSMTVGENYFSAFMNISFCLIFAVIVDPYNSSLLLSC